MTTVDLGRLPRGQDGQLVIGNTGKSPLWKTVSGDATLSSAGALTLSAAFQDALTPACFFVHRNGTDQTGVADATFTQITWTTEVYDVGGHFASSAWTPPAGKVFMIAGFYATPDAAAVPTGCSCSIFKNGSNFKINYGAAVFGVNPTAVSCEDIANGTDVYTVSVYVNAVGAGTETITGSSAATYFQGHWISP